MEDKFVLITGASSGIGRSIAIKLSYVGYKCILVGRNNVRLDATLNMLHSNGHIIFSGDLNDNEFLDYLSFSVPKLNAIIHSAGIIKLVPLKFIKKDDFTNILDTNLISPFFLTQKLLNRKKLFTSSSIVFISSISGPIIGSKGNLMYSASKSAVNGMIKTLALELAYLKIRVNSISAGMVLTEMWDTGNDIIAIDQLRFDEKKYPLGYGKPKDIASIVLFLVSDGSTWITGSTIIADGGFTIQ